MHMKWHLFEVVVVGAVAAEEGRLTPEDQKPELEDRRGEVSRLAMGTKDSTASG